MTHARTAAGALALGLIAIILGCGQDVSVPVSDAEMSVAGASPEIMESPAAISLSKSAGGAPIASAQSSTGAATSPVVIPSMIIRNGSATLEVDSLEPAMAAVQQMAVRFGGYVGNSSLSATEFQWRSATLELKIPAARFDSALAGLEAVDAVVVFDEDTPFDLVQAIEPDVIVKGGDYSPDTIVGADLVTARGGRVVVIPLVDGHSTTSTIEKLRG